MNASGRRRQASRSAGASAHLTGFGDSMNRQTAHGPKRFRIGVEQTREIENALFELIFHGVLERHPKLKIVSVENEVGWMPFWMGQCDKGFKRHRHSEKVQMSKLPSEYFAEQIYATFFNDLWAAKCFPGGARITACGPTTTRTRIPPGPIPAR